MELKNFRNVLQNIIAIESIFASFEIVVHLKIWGNKARKIRKKSKNKILSTILSFNLVA